MPDPEIPELTNQDLGGVEVDIGGDASPPAQTPPPAAQVVAPPAPEIPAVGVDELKRQLKSMEEREASALRERSNMERIAREQADKLALAEAESAKARGEAIDQRRGSIESSIVASQTESDMARRDYQLALEAGDFQKAAEANQKQIRAAAIVASLEQKKTALDEAPRQQAAEPARPYQGAVTQPQPSNDIEAYIRTKTPRTQEWLRAHPETVTDERMNNKTVAAHYEARSEGYSPDTDSYFDFIDRRLGFAGQVVLPPTEDPAAKRQRTAPPAAPTSRDSPRAESSTRMYLTRGELETADQLGLSPSDYAKRKAAMQKAGYYHS